MIMFMILNIMTMMVVIVIVIMTRMVILDGDDLIEIVALCVII